MVNNKCLPFYCPSAEYWELLVAKEKYRIEYKKVKDYSGPYGGIYDYICTCGHYKKNGLCLHITSNIKCHCGWIQYLEGDKPTVSKGQLFCPLCSEKLLLNMKIICDESSPYKGIMVQCKDNGGQVDETILAKLVYKELYGKVKGLGL